MFNGREKTRDPRPHAIGYTTENTAHIRREGNKEIVAY